MSFTSFTHTTLGSGKKRREPDAELNTIFFEWPQILVVVYIRPTMPNVALRLDNIKM